MRSVIIEYLEPFNFRVNANDVLKFFGHSVPDLFHAA